MKLASIDRSDNGGQCGCDQRQREPSHGRSHEGFPSGFGDPSSSDLGQDDEHTSETEVGPECGVDVSVLQIVPLKKGVCKSLIQKNARYRQDGGSQSDDTVVLRNQEPGQHQEGEQRQDLPPGRIYEGPEGTSDGLLLHPSNSVALTRWPQSSHRIVADITGPFT